MVANKQRFHKRVFLVALPILLVLIFFNERINSFLSSLFDSKLHCPDNTIYRSNSIYGGASVPGSSYCSVTNPVDQILRVVLLLVLLVLVVSAGYILISWLHRKRR
jgi:hypothetical protein